MSSSKITVNARIYICIRISIPSGNDNCSCTTIWHTGHVHDSTCTLSCGTSRVLSAPVSGNRESETTTRHYQDKLELTLNLMFALQPILREEVMYILSTGERAYYSYLR